MNHIKNEIWKDITGYEGLYQISSLGRVKKFNFFTKGKNTELKEKIFFTKHIKNSYKNFSLVLNGVSKSFKLHRLVAEAFIPNPENKRCVNHKNGLRYDNRVENLEWVTHSENNFDRWKNYKNNRTLNLVEFVPAIVKQKTTDINVGDKINMLTLINKLPKNYWLFKCECGKEKIIYASSVVSGHTKSCGCLIKMSSKRAKLHGLSGTVEYNTWCSIKERCYNTKNKYYYNYGGRGIVMSENWINSPEQFVYDMGKRPSKDYSIERIDNNGNYCKENCKWATRQEQQNNRRNTVLINYNNETKTLIDWCKILNLNYKTIETRIRLGWSYEEAFITPIKHNIKKLDKEKVIEIKKLNSMGLDSVKIARIFNVDPALVRGIIKNKYWKHV